MTTKPQHTEDAPVTRANLPGVYTCPHCGQRLSGPPSLYRMCPERPVPVENLGRDA